MTKVIYHRADFDGLFCREIARKFLPEAVLIGWDYGDAVPDPTVVSTEDTLYMLDISVEGLMGHPKLVWIDHHKSAIEKYGAKIAGYRIDGVAACRLAWQWFNRMGDVGGVLSFPEKRHFVDRIVNEPLAVRLAGEYDIWDKRDPDAELFQHGLRSVPLTDGIWDELLEPKNMPLLLRQLLDNGAMLQWVKGNENEDIITHYGFTAHFEGLTFLCCNHARFNSHLFTAGIKPEHDALLGFKWTGKDWSVSLYHAPGKDQHDLSLIATKYGGGGHRGACGFRCVGKAIPNSGSPLPFIK